MKIRHLIKALGSGALVAAVLAFSSSANALVTQLIHFDDAGNGWDWYSDVDNNFLFDPTNLQSGNCADSTDGGNGSCLIEVEQGSITTMTRPENGPQDPGATPREDPIVSGALEFTLDSIYFNLSGVGQDPTNSITITDVNNPSTNITFALGGTNDQYLTFYDGANAGDPAGVVVHNQGYIATFGDFFADVTEISFTSHTSANVRLDCVVATFDGTTTEPQSSFSGGCGGASVPEPGTLALMGLGLAGMGFARRRKKV